MAKTPAISDAEWEVMNVLWSASAPMVAEQVVDQLSTRKQWSDRTIKTLLNRLIKKGSLKFELQGKRYLYRPAVRQDQCVRDAGRSFLSRVFRGSAGPMLIHFVTHTDLSQSEVEELQRLLQEKHAGIAKKKGR